MGGGQTGATRRQPEARTRGGRAVAASSGGDRKREPRVDVAHAGRRGDDTFFR